MTILIDWVGRSSERRGWIMEMTRLMVEIDTEYSMCRVLEFKLPRFPSFRFPESLSPLLIRLTVFGKMANLPPQVSPQGVFDSWIHH